MGIQLDDFDKRMIRAMAIHKESGVSVYPYLYGYLYTAVDMFLAGHSEKRDLETMYTLVKLIERLCKTHSAEELREFSSGTREIPGEDVPSGQ